ncbi:hypothetical protein G6514_010447 [Epicoccum nigrum]|nr:hypothetical protein G6514_010447 [Epicoccum nigrum]
MKSTLKPAVSNATVIGGAVLSRSSTSTTTIVVTSTSTAASTTAATSSTSSSSETPTPTNVIVNGGFESPNMSPWYISGLYFDAGRSTSKPHSGKYSFRAHGSVRFLFDVTLSQKVSVVPDTAYNLFLSVKQNIPTCVFSGFYEDVPIFADVKLTGTDYATIAAQIPIFATGFDSGALTIAATGCLGTSVWFDDISMTPA